MLGNNVHSDDEDTPTSQLSVLVATTVVAALALACTGSAVVWRSKHLLFSNTAHSSTAMSSTALDEPTNVDPGSSGKDNKQQARPKERRRRGKDPLKELIKAEKKGKPIPGAGLERQNQPGDSSTVGTSSALLGPRDPSTSSRSVSSASSSVRTPEPVNAYLQQDATATTSSARGALEGTSRVHGGTADDEDTLTFSSFSSRENSSKREHALSSQPHSHAAGSDSSSATTASLLHTPNASTSSMHGPADTSIILTSDSNDPSSAVPGSSPSLFIPASSQSVPIYLSSSGSPPPPPFSESKSRLSGPRGNIAATNGWDWDGNSTVYDTTTVYRKPPRFRSKSRNSSSDASAILSSSASFPAHYASSSNLNSNGSAGSSTSLPPVMDEEEGSSPLSFPSLNAQTPGSLPSRHGNGASSGTFNEADAGTLPSPSPSTNDSLSANTQLASLRGALEAAKAREEKARKEAERYQKELEVIKWEGMNWKRREAEMQNQIHMLLHQLQAFSVAAGHGFSPSPIPVGQQSSASPHLQIPQPHFSMPNSPHSPYPPSRPQQQPSSSPSPSPKPPHSTPSRAPSHNPQSQPNNPQLPPQVQQQQHALLHPIQLFSPPLHSYPQYVHSNPQSPSFYFSPSGPSSASSAQPSPLGHGSPHAQQQQMFSMMFPHMIPSLASPPGGDISAGSMSPEFESATSIPISGRPILTRGRKKMRRHGPSNSGPRGDRTAGNMASSTVMGEAWVVDSPVAEEVQIATGGAEYYASCYGEGSGGESGREDGGDGSQDIEGEEEEEQLSELLVGAIMKRPEMMRLPTRSRSARNRDESQRASSERRSSGMLSTGSAGGVIGTGEDVVFTFPSISNSMPMTMLVPRERERERRVDDVPLTQASAQQFHGEEKGDEDSLDDNDPPQSETRAGNDGDSVAEDEHKQDVPSSSPRGLGTSDIYHEYQHDDKSSIAHPPSIEVNLKAEEGS